MRKNKSYINLKVIGNDSELSSFLCLCSTIQKLGVRGSSRKIPVIVDGDGSGRLTFYLNGDGECLPMTDDPVPNTLTEIFIGE